MNFFLLIPAELVSQNIDPHLSAKIAEYTKEGDNNVREMKRLLK